MKQPTQNDLNIAKDCILQSPTLTAVERAFIESKVSTFEDILTILKTASPCVFGMFLTRLATAYNK